jgi:signal transduction histidine kinase
LSRTCSNAAKYSAPADATTVRIETGSASVQVAVLDRGIGFGDAESERLFDPFYRSDAARGVASGLGIGLALCKRIVEELGGRTGAAPRDGGRTEVGFTLPLLAVDPR